MITTILTGLVLIVLFIYYVSKRKFNYWEKQKILYIKPAPFLGNYGNYILMKKYFGQVVQSICEKFPDAPYIGAFYGTEPTLVVQDPEMLKTIMTKDYYYFSSREISNYTHKEIVTQNLFFTYGDRWKVLRQNLSPLFSSSKMKHMFHLIEKCSHVFQDMLDYEYKISDVQEVRPLIARYTMDCIGACAFGIDTKTMASTCKDNPFVIMGNILFLDTLYRGFKIVARAIWPSIFYGLGMKAFPTESDAFFNNLMTKVFSERQYKPTNRNDFVDLILNLKNENSVVGDSIKNMNGGNNKIQLTFDDEMLVAQCVLFFAAGFETSATTLQYTLYELAKNQEAQNRVITEIDEYLKRHKNKLLYDCVNELPYTEACIDEASRLYPVLGVLTREVMDDYTLPCGAVLEKGIRIHIPVYHLHHHPNFFPEPEVFRPERFVGEEKRNIKPYTYMPFGEGPRICIVAGILTREVMDDYTLPCGAVLEKGVRIHVPVYHLHHHPDFFPEPEEFRPERFVGEEKRKIKPYTYMPFGEGPRICIGMRFAKMQMFAGIITVLKKYRVELADDTPLKLEFTATSFVTQPKQMIKLKFVERENWKQREFA